MDQSPFAWNMQGEQAFISYGTHGNDSLLQYFGFVERDNPHDKYTVPDILQSDPAVAKAYGLPEGQKAKWEQVCCCLGRTSTALAGLWCRSDWCQGCHGCSACAGGLDEEGPR